MGRFPQTRWSLVVRAGSTAGPVGRRALSELCELYWSPLFAFLRAQGMPREEAQEVVQGFFAGFISRDGFDKAERDRGRLRTFLLASLRNHLAQARQRKFASKRGALVTDSTAMDVIDATVFNECSLESEQVFMRAWARRVIDSAMQQLREEYASRGKIRVFDALRGSLVERSDDDLLASSGLNAGAAKVALHRLRKRFGDRLRREVAATVDDPRHIDDELRALIAVMSDL